MQRKNPHQKLSQTIGCRRENLREAFSYELVRPVGLQKGIMLEALRNEELQVGHLHVAGLTPPGSAK